MLKDTPSRGKKKSRVKIIFVVLVYEMSPTGSCVECFVSISAGDAILGGGRNFRRRAYLGH
jgi:hypothetical protein